MGRSAAPYRRFRRRRGSARPGRCARPQRSWPGRGGRRRRPPPRLADLLPLDLTVGAPNVTLLSHGPNPEPDTNAVPPDPPATSGPASTCWPSTAASAPIAKATGAGRRRAERHHRPVLLRRCATAPPRPTPRVRFDRRAGRWIVTMITRALPNRYPGGGEQHRRRSPAGSPGVLPVDEHPHAGRRGRAAARAWATTRRSAFDETRLLHRRQPALRRRRWRR